MLLEVLLLADPYLLFPGTNGHLRRMSECPGDMAAYWKLSDSVLKQIETSYAPVRLKACNPHVTNQCTCIALNTYYTFTSNIELTVFIIDKQELEPARAMIHHTLHSEFIVSKLS